MPVSGHALAAQAAASDRLETGFGGGKTHGLIAAVHLAHEGTNLADALRAYGQHGVLTSPVPSR
ncbi:MAG: hypothetical protein HY331_15425 [Chloroflexi bacterium]|nr:hypothetical protein [Chloroflexota bacterium]